MFESSYFKFNGNFYKQLDGTAMGNPTSPVLANIVMNHLIMKSMEKLNSVIHFIYIYVDDLILAAPKNKIDIILSNFNSFNTKLRFTAEIEVDGRIPFLDVCLIRTDEGKISTDWYVKPTASGRVLNFLSTHNIQHKKNIILNMLHKINLLSAVEYRKNNIQRMIKILTDNNYPKFFINSIIKKFYDKQSNKLKKQQQQQ